MIFADPVWRGPRLSVPLSSSGGHFLALSAAVVACLGQANTEVVPAGLPPHVLARLRLFIALRDHRELIQVASGYVELSIVVLEEGQPEAEPPPYDIPRSVGVSVVTRHHGDGRR